VHCHNKTATIRAAAVARFAGASAVVSTRHGFGPVPFRLRKELKFWTTAGALCDRVVAVCEAARRNFAAGAPPVARKLVTIRNGAAAPKPAAAGVERGAGFTLIAVGRLACAKDYATLLRAAALARIEVPDLIVWMVGAGGEEPALRQLCTGLNLDSVVRFCGERRDVGGLLAAADVFVLSSTSEGLPISMLEAMAVGLPAIVTEVGALPELVALSGAGTTVPPRDAGRFARAIVDLARRRHELPALGALAARCYRRHFTPARMAGEYLNLYRACLRGEAAGR
jgi:glycosyltransferase involved in cell wall biosynthesis